MLLAWQGLVVVEATAHAHVLGLPRDVSVFAGGLVGAERRLVGHVADRWQLRHRLVEASARHHALRPALADRRDLCSQETRRELIISIEQVAWLL